MQRSMESLGPPNSELKRTETNPYHAMASQEKRNKGNHSGNAPDEGQGTM